MLSMNIDNKASGISISDRSSHRQKRPNRRVKRSNVPSDMRRSVADTVTPKAKTEMVSEKVGVVTIPSKPLSFDVPLHTPWVIWYHKQEEPSWERDSFMEIYRMCTVMEYVMFRNSFAFLPQFLNGFYFFMKDGVFPVWEDPRNRLGGCYNIKIAKENIDTTVWECMNYALLNGLFMKEDNNRSLTGISIAPKKYNALFKVWNDDKRLNDPHAFHRNIQSLKRVEIVYRLHHTSEGVTLFKDEYKPVVG